MIQLVRYGKLSVGPLRGTTGKMVCREIMAAYCNATEHVWAGITQSA
jgi:hypothetical protein